MCRVFANGPGDQGLIADRFIPKTQKRILDVTLLNTQHYKVRIKGKDIDVHFLFEVYLKRIKKIYIYILALKVIIITQMRISNSPGKTWPWGGGVTVSSVKSTNVTRKIHSA